MDYGASRSKALSSQGPGALFFSRAQRVMTNPFAPSGAKVSRAGNSVLPQRGRVFPFFSFEGGHHVCSNPSQFVPTARRSARRPVRSATFDRAEATRM